MNIQQPRKCISNGTFSCVNILTCILFLFFLVEVFNKILTRGKIHKSLGATWPQILYSPYGGICEYNVPAYSRFQMDLFGRMCIRQCRKNAKSFLSRKIERILLMENIESETQTNAFRRHAKKNIFSEISSRKWHCWIVIHFVFRFLKFY